MSRSHFACGPTSSIRFVRLTRRDWLADALLFAADYRTNHEIRPATLAASPHHPGRLDQPAAASRPIPFSAGTGNWWRRSGTTAVGNILREHGIEPIPERQRQSTWKEFLEAHWDVLGAIDFTTIEVWTKSGLVTFYLLFVMEVATRRVHFAGCTANPNEDWMKQAARNLTDSGDGSLLGTRYLLMDRDAKFCTSFRAILREAGVKPVRLPPRSPHLNAHLERFMRSLKEECLERMIFFGESSLRKATTEFLAHYHGERNHQGLDNRLIHADAEVGRTAGLVQCRKRLDGMLRYYYWAAA